MTSWNECGSKIVFYNLQTNQIMQKVLSVKCVGHRKSVSCILRGHRYVIACILNAIADLCIELNDKMCYIYLSFELDKHRWSSYST